MTENATKTIEDRLNIRSVKSTEDYLAAIWNITRDTQNANLDPRPVRIKDIAEKLNISSPSVSEYVRKLAMTNKLEVIDRKGVIFTREGEREAKLVINKHRIVECFLKNCLGMEEKISCNQSHEMEHVLELETVDKLYTFLRGTMGGECN